MSPSLLGFVIGLLCSLSFGAGVWAADRMGRKHWRVYRYCPTCDRLDCERENDRGGLT